MTSTSAAKATGPVTEAGKAKMRDNALSHGLTSKHAVIKGEDPEEYAAPVGISSAIGDPRTPGKKCS